MSIGRSATLLILCFAHFSFAQTIKGFVLDKETQLPIPYVNIGIVNKNIGTVSSPDGFFEIHLDNKYERDSLRFSSIGYESSTFLIGDFRDEASSSKTKIGLVPKAITLQEVVITSESRRALVLGHLPKSKFTKAGFFYNRLGHEIGTLFESESSAPIYLDSVQLNFATCSYDSVFLRLNVYRVEDELVENVLPQNVFINLAKKETLSNPIINLTPYGLWVGKKYLVSIEIVKDLGELGLKFYCTLKVDRYPTLYRGTSQDTWKTAYHKSKPVGISILTYSH